jgi:pilus assembly protein Flp/PilA
MAHGKERTYMLAYGCALVERAKAELALVIGDRRGVTALEYGVIAAVTVAAVATTIGTVGTRLSSTWTNIANAL